MAERSQAGGLQQGSARDWFADHIGVGPERKEEVYRELSGAATLFDASYWLQIVFSSGIATLGLALNSPAVIIGAMLISPLMGPILAAGLSLAAGDLILGIRAIVNLALSCFVAIAFAVLLATVLPFKEITGEIAARTQPNTLDLMIAFFSGAIGSLATCKEVKGVVTSIPGVSIAVALMPPLCVVGFGIGLALTFEMAEGLRVARGGGLLFLTNLIAITFSAMLVFLSLHIDTESVRQRIREWMSEDRESFWYRQTLERIHVSERFRKVGSLPGRLIMIAIPILIILIPLSQSLGQMRDEITRKQKENHLRRTVTAVWQDYFTKFESGEPRSYIDNLSSSERDGKLNFFLRVFTSQPYTNEEQRYCARLIAERLNRPAETIGLQIVEIPTTAAGLATRVKEEKEEAPPTLAQLRASFLQAVDSSLRGLRLPPHAQMADYQVTASPSTGLEIGIDYLSERNIDADASALIIEEVRSRLELPDVKVELEKIPATPPPIRFNLNRSTLDETLAGLLDLIGQRLQRLPSVEVEIIANREKREREAIIDERAQAIAEYLKTKWGIEPRRIKTAPGADSSRDAVVKLRIASP
ncbi:MAG: DUF389 domain-containing protein [Acidobacteriota bacterium]